MFMCPYGYTATYPPNTDYIIMDDLMEDACNAIYNVNGFTYAYGPVYHVIYQASGGSNDWSYGEEGIVASFALEARGTSFTPPVSQITPVGSEICVRFRQDALSVEGPFTAPTRRTLKSSAGER